LVSSPSADEGNLYFVRTPLATRLAETFSSDIVWRGERKRAMGRRRAKRRREMVSWKAREGSD
jgi:hypothetical protein